MSDSSRYSWSGKKPQWREPIVKPTPAPCPCCGCEVSCGDRHQIRDTQGRFWHEECAAEVLAIFARETTT